MFDQKLQLLSIHQNGNHMCVGRNVSEPNITQKEGSATEKDEKNKEQMYMCGFCKNGFISDSHLDIHGCINLGNNQNIEMTNMWQYI